MRNSMLAVFGPRCLWVTSRLLGKRRVSVPARVLNWTAGIARLVLTALLALVSLGLCAQAGASTALNKVYDDAGRLVQIVASDGSSILYSYDLVGNLISSQVVTSSTLTFTAVAPSHAAPGDTVTLTGSGFIPTPDANTVTFNGASGDVLTATANALTVVVPATATSGPITVTNSNGSVTSAFSFTVTNSEAPSIASFSPVLGSAGTTVTLSGAAFQSSSNTQVAFGGVTAAAPVIASSQTLTAVVPASAQSGPLSITTPYGTATSTNPFFVVPAGIAPNLVSTTASIVVNGPAVNANFAASDDYVLLTFNGSAGQNLSVAATISTLIPNDGTGNFNLSIYRPGNNVLANCTQVTKCTIPSLPMSGTYIIAIHIDSAHHGIVPVWLSTDIISGALVLDATATSVAATRPGQNLRYTFNGTIGQQLGIAVQNMSASASVIVLAPDQITTVSSYNGASLLTFGSVLPTLPSNGTYTVIVSPNGSAILTGTLNLLDNVTGTLTANGAAVTFNSLPAQRANYTFSATAGQNLSLAWSGATFPGLWSVITVYDPNGKIVSQANFASRASAINYDSGDYSSGVIKLQNLVLSGTYSVVIQPCSPGIGQVTVQLTADVVLPIKVDGPSVTMNQLPGQNLRYTFTGTTGQLLGIGMTNISSYTTLTVLGPNQAAIMPNCTSQGLPANGCTVLALPSSGTYTILVTPNGAASLMGTLTLSSDIGGGLTANAPTTTLNVTRPGQNGFYTFTATAGQNSALSFISADFSGLLTIYQPNGTTILNQTQFLDPADLAVNGVGISNGVISLANLPQTGTYTVLIQPYRAGTGNFYLQLVGNTTGTIIVDGAPVSMNQLPAQIETYTFTGTAGQNLGLGFTNLSSAPTVQIIKPDQVTSLAPCYSGGQAGFGCVLPTLPVSGTYSIVVTPSGVSSLTGTMTLTSDAGGVLTANAPTTTLNVTRPGQNGFYTFTATAGQNSTLSFISADFSGLLTIYQPNGTTILNQT